MKDFNQKIIVITGAASGMGRSMAIQLAQQGATVLISDVNLAEARRHREAKELKYARGLNN